MCEDLAQIVAMVQPALIAAGRGDVPVIELRFRYGACGG